MRKMIFSFFLAGACAFGGEYYYINNGKRIELKPQSDLSLRSYGNKLQFVDQSGHFLSISNRILVKFRSVENLKKYMDEFGLQLVKKYSFGNLYLFKTSSPETAINAANVLSKKDDVEYSQPDIIKKRELR